MKHRKWRNFQCPQCEKMKDKYCYAVRGDIASFKGVPSSTPCRDFIKQGRIIKE